MTAQATDAVLLHGERFLICGVNGSELADPSQWGLKPEMPSTACYRGWVAEYRIDDRIELANLYVFHDAGLPVKNRKPNGPVINGIAPQEPDASGSAIGFNCLYKDLGLPIQFTGGLLLGTGFVRGLMVNMGFHPFWKFEKVHELMFEQGRVLSCVDKSEVASTVREKHLVNGLPGRPDLSRESEVAAWIDQSFSLQYVI